MRALMIHDGVRGAVRNLIEYARRNVVTASELKKSMQTGNAVGDEGGHKIEIPHGFRAVFSFEEQPIGLCRHLSVSVDAPGKWPHEAAVREIAELFGMQLSCCTTWLEKEFRAVNVLQKEPE